MAEADFEHMEETMEEARKQALFGAPDISRTVIPHAEDMFLPGKKEPKRRLSKEEKAKIKLGKKEAARAAKAERRASKGRRISVTSRRRESNNVDSVDDNAILAPEEDRCSPEVKSASFESAGTHVSFQTEMIETASTQVSDAEEDTLETNNEHEHPDSEMQHDGMHDSVLTASPPYIETNTRKATVNEQMIAGALTGQKTNVDANSKQILTEREAQAVLAQYRRVNNQITGDVKREGADVSYYNDEGKRFAEPEGILQYQYDYESEFLEEVKDLPFYHGTSETTQAITVLLHRSGEGSYLLRSVDGKVCLSYQTKLLVSHHTFRKGEDGSMEVDGSPFHAAGFIRFPSCTTITQVIRQLELGHEYWPGPLTHTVARGRTVPAPLPGSTLPTSAVVRNERRNTPYHRAQEKRRQQEVLAQLNQDEPLMLTKASARQLQGRGVEARDRLLGKEEVARVAKSCKPLEKPEIAETVTTTKVEPEATEQVEPQPDTARLPAPPKKKISMASLPHGPAYHADISKKEACDLLLENDGAKVSGKFLIRDSEADEFVLSVVYKEKITHHLIGVRNGKITLNKKTTPASNVVQLTRYLRSKRADLKWPVPLVKPVLSKAAKQLQIEAANVPEELVEETEKEAKNQDNQRTDDVETGTAEVEPSVGGGDMLGVLDAQAVDIVRSKHMGDMTRETHAPFNPLRGSASSARHPSVNHQAESILRETGAQRLASSPVKQHTGAVLKDVKADASFFDPTPDKIFARLSESVGHIQRATDVLAGKKLITPAVPNKAK